jgi:hypothetical protein
MPIDAAKNFAKVTVSTGYDASATSIALTAGHGLKLPTAPFNAVWWNSTDYSDPSDDPDVEIVRVTNVATDTLTVTRAQEGTSASVKNSGGKTYRMVAGLLAAAANTLATQSDIVYPCVVRLDSSGFNGVTTTFTDQIPYEPDLVNNEIVLLHSGVGPLRRVAAGATPGQFSLSGATNRTPTYGFAPETGDEVYAVFVRA